MVSLICLSFIGISEWGFFGHRKINRMAVFSLPPEMILFYKKNIEFITEHAVDPDKRRYATKFEAVRHYIDIDHWGTYPFDNVPRKRLDALMKFTDVFVINSQQDTIQVFGHELSDFSDGYLLYQKNNDPRIIPVFQAGIKRDAYRSFYQSYFIDQYYEDEWTIPCDRLKELIGEEAVNQLDCERVFAVDRFSEWGILPYHLVSMQNRLTEAFREKSVNKILRLSAEMGHYIGDAHVPLHTTENYNGQLTDQVGIHAFWESRLPELFADEDYNFFVGKAVYIDDPTAYYWDIILTSHRLVDSVLTLEQNLKEEFPQDQQFCYEERLNRTIRTQCREFSKAYHERLDGMVERRMRAAIRAIGSSWFTAWVDAGQPNLRKMQDYRPTKKELKRLKEEEAAYSGGKIKGRKH